MLSVETFAWMPDGAKLGNFVFTSISTEGIRRRGKGQSVCTPYDTLIFLVLTAAAVHFVMLSTMDTVVVHHYK